MSSCPIKTDPDWIALVKVYDPADAMTAYINNNYTIPTLAEAEEIFKKIRVVKDKDEQLSASSDEFKLRKAVEQRGLLEKASFTANPVQKETIDKLVAMNTAYQEFLRKNIEIINDPKTSKSPEKTTSVSKFIGSSEFKGDPKEYEAFKLFGTFVHDLLEVAQVEALKNNTSISKVYNQEFFDKAYEKYIEKNPFTIENLSREELYDMAFGLVQNVNEKNKSGFIILPEITVVGKTATGTTIVGRLDLLLIDSQGRVHIYDFKTKKMSYLVQYNSMTNSNEVDVDRGLYELSMKETGISNQSGTGTSFRQVSTRTTYDTWMLQLDVYENMLMQSGINVRNKNIASLLYHIDRNDKSYKGSVLYVFDDEDYYGVVRNTSINTDGQFYNDVDSTNEHVLKLKRAVNIEIPVEGKVTDDDAVNNKSIDEVYDVTPTEKNIKDFIESIEKLIDGQIQKLTEDIENSKSKPEIQRNKDYEKILTTRRDSIKNFKSIVDKLKSANPSDILYATNFFNALSIVEDDLNVLIEVSSIGADIYNDANSTSIDKSKALAQVTEAFNKVILFKQVLDILENIVDEASQAEDSKITSDSPVRLKLSDLRLSANIITANFKDKVAMNNAIEILKSPGETVYQKVSEQQIAALIPQLEFIKKQIEDLKTNPKLGLYSRIKFATFSFMDKDFKEKFKEAMGPDGPIVAARLEKLERQKIKVEALLQGYSFEDSAIEAFINGITDPAALFYPGMANPLESDTMLSGWNLDSMIASASNSDRVVSAFTTFLKEHKAQAEHNVMTDQKIKNLMAVVNRLLDAGFKLENLNESISEWRTLEYTDPKTGERVQKRILDIAKPYSEEYESTYKNYSMRIKELNKEIYDLKAEYYKEHKTANEDVAKQKFLDKVAERDEFNNDYIEWLINNASLPYSDEFYKLQLKLPNEIREKLQKLYLEQEVILHDVGKGNEALLPVEDFDRLQELDTEIRRIRIDANEKNLDYAQYLEKLEELYEYDLNEDAYKRAEKDALTRFSDDPERLNIWKKTNTVSRPTSEWYEILGALYEERAEIYGSDPEIKDLMDAKRKIMAPYKQNGRFNPKYLSEDEIAELDKIESNIETIIEQNKKDAKNNITSLTEEQQKRAREINDEIRKLVTLQLNPIYTEEFDQRYRILRAKYDAMIVADSNLNNLSAKTGATTEDIDVAQEDWIEAITAFGKEEQDFEYWYNNYHQDKYAKMSETQDHKDRRVPKNFNFERLPTSLLASKYMETVPNPKYYKIKRLKLGNWTLDGKKLNNREIEELQKNPEEIERLLNAGRIITKPGAINPNFLKSPDGIPMPKEIIKNDDGTYGVNPKMAVTNNVNQKFKDLLGNPERLALYNALTTLFFDLQQKTEGRKIGYQVPGMAASTVESFATLGLKEGFATQYKAFMDKHLKVASQTDASENTYGDLGERIRMRFSNQLSEDIQSTDAIGSVLKWTTEAHMNIAMQDVAPKSKSFITYLELQIEKLKEDSLKGDTYITNDKGERVIVDSAKKVTEIEKLVEILKYENKKFLYGITEDEQNRKLSKYVNSFFKYTSFIRIGFDVANQIKNYASGNVQAFLAAGNNSSDHYTQKDFLYAKGKVYSYDGFLANYFKDWGKVDDVSESTLLYRMINPAQKEIIKYYSDIAGGRKRKLSEKATNVGDLGFLLQDKGDTEIAVTVMFAVMNHNKYEVIESTDPATGEKIFKRDAEGKVEMVTAENAYFKDASGNLVIRPDVNYNKKEENRLRNIIYSEMRRAQGNYAKIDQTKFESKTMGKMVFFFRKFLVPQFLNRFGYMRPNWEGSEVALGYWRAVTKAYKYFGAANTMKEFFIGSNTLTKMNMSGGTRTYTIKDPVTKKVISQEEVGDFYAKRIHHARRDAIAMAFLTMLSMMLLSYVKRKDDDDEEVGIIEGNLIRVIWGIKAETVSMFPVGEGSNEYVKNFTTAIPFIREATAAKNFINHGIKYGTAMLINGGEEPDPGYDSEFYQEIWKDAFYTRKYGAYEKGDAKVMKDFVDLTGIKNFRDLVHPQYKIDVLKGKQ